jgi:translation initiation factor 1
MERRKYGKPVTIIVGINNHKIAESLLTSLRRKLACGGTLRGTLIELQGDHIYRLKKILVAEGYSIE